MSQRALKKREQSLQKQEKKEPQQIYRNQLQQLTTQKSKYTQRTNSVLSKHSVIKSNQIDNIHKSDISVSNQKFCSTPNLVSTIDSEDYNNQLIRSHSESDLTSMLESNPLVNAKSEFHLKSIASTQVPSFQSLPSSTPNHQRSTKKAIGKQQTMDSPTSSLHSKRLSIQSGFSGQTISSMTSSASDSTQPPTVGFCSTESVRIPIVGYEVMEERARFTVT